MLSLAGIVGFSAVMLLVPMLLCVVGKAGTWEGRQGEKAHDTEHEARNAHGSPL